MSHFTTCKEIKPPFTKAQLLALTEAKKTGKKVLIQVRHSNQDADYNSDGYYAAIYQYAYPSGKIRKVTHFLT